MAAASKKTSARWSLSGSQSQPSCSSESDLSDEYTVVRDTELGVDALFLKVGKEPARSKRTGEVYDKPVVGVRRNKDKMEVSKLHCIEFQRQKDSIFTQNHALWQVMLIQTIDLLN